MFFYFHSTHPSTGRAIVVELLLCLFCDFIPLSFTISSMHLSVLPLLFVHYLFICAYNASNLHSMFFTFPSGSRCNSNQFGGRTCCGNLKIEQQCCVVSCRFMYIHRYAFISRHMHIFIFVVVSAFMHVWVSLPLSLLYK